MSRPLTARVRSYQSSVIAYQFIARSAWPVDRCAACSADATLLTRLPGPPGRRRCSARAARSVRHARLSGAVRRTDAAHAARSVEFHDQRRSRRCGVVDVGRVHRAAAGNGHRRHPLRHQVVQGRHHLDRCFGPHPARRRRHRCRLRHRLVRRWLYDQPPARGPDRWPGVDRLRVRGRAARARARRPGPAARPAPVLLEEREVGPRPRAARPRRARLLGDLRLPQLRRSVERAALPGGLIVAPARIAWRLAAVNDVIVETPGAKTLVLDAPGWPGHLAGQHVDVRLTAADGYQAQRSYSIASAPEDPTLMLTVERLEDGEVSPYLTDELVPCYELELRGPIGGYFVWRSHDGGPLLLLAGGSGFVPLMPMLRHRAAHSSTADTRLLLSARSSEEVLYRDELARLAAGDGLAVHQTFTREPPAGWSGFARRVDADMLSRVGPAPSQRPRIFVCGPTAFVERAADLLVGLGHDSAAIHLERFGPTGG